MARPVKTGLQFLTLTLLPMDEENSNAATTHEEKKTTFEL
jgi:hypothetical protein